jgi:predicted nucleotidyltransferase
MLQIPKPQPVESLDNLRTRVERMLRARDVDSSTDPGPLFAVSKVTQRVHHYAHPTKSIGEFLDFLVDAMPAGDVYLFGGILRDVALLGRRGFSSDIDLVVEGQWSHCVSYLESLGAQQNKFGGFRLRVAEWPVDIWNAEETWAIRHGYVSYRGIGSLTETTVLNWDAILMNWRSKSFVHKPNYLRDIGGRVLDLVMKENPNPLGMAVRVFRHLWLKDARKVTRALADYLSETTRRFTFDEIKREELRSYGTSVISPALYQLFSLMNPEEGVGVGERYGIAVEALRRELDLW